MGIERNKFITADRISSGCPIQLDPARCNFDAEENYIHTYIHSSPPSVFHEDTIGKTWEHTVLRTSCRQVVVVLFEVSRAAQLLSVNPTGVVCNSNDGIH